MAALKNKKATSESGFIHSRNGSLVLNAPACIITYDTHLRITGWNPFAEKTFGYKMGETMGQKLIDIIVHHTQLNEDLASFKKALEGESIIESTQYRPIKNGSLITVTESLFPIHNQENEVIGGT